MANPLRIENPGIKPDGARCRIGTPRFVGRFHLRTCQRLVDGSAMAVDVLGIHEFEAGSATLRRSFLGTLPGTPHIATVTGDVFFVADHELSVWRRGTAEILPVCTLPQTTKVSVSPDGTHVAVDVDSKVKVLRCADGEAIATLTYPYGESFELATGARWVLFSQDIPVQSGSCWMEYVTVSLSGQQVETGNAFGDGACIYLSTDGLSVVCEHNPLSPPPPDYYTAWGEGAEPLAVGPGGDAALTPHGLFDLRAQTVRPLEPRDEDRVQTLHLSATQARCLWRSGHLVTHDLRGGTPPATVKLPGGSRRLSAFSRDGHWAACHTADRTGARLEVFEEHSAEPVPRTLPPGHFEPKCLAVLGDGRVLIASPCSLNILSGDEPRRMNLPMECDPREVATSDDGRVVAVRAAKRYGWTSPPGPVFVFVDDVAETLVAGETLATAAWSVAVQPDGRRIAVSSTESISVWSVRPFDVVATMACGPAVSLAFSADGRNLIAGHADTTVTVWDLCAPKIDPVPIS